MIYLIDEQSSGIPGNLDLTQVETDLPAEFRTPFEPVRKKPYPYSQDKKKVIQDQINDMLHQQVMEPSMSPCCSPIVLTKRMNGESCFCIDFRGLNAITEDVTQALPLIPDVIKEFGDSVVFTTLDLKNGYCQVPLDPDSRNYTAFAAPDGGTYRFKVMPFGLKTATNTF